MAYGELGSNPIKGCGNARSVVDLCGAARIGGGVAATYKGLPVSDPRSSGTRVWLLSPFRVRWRDVEELMVGGPGCGGQLTRTIPVTGVAQVRAGLRQPACVGGPPPGDKWQLGTRSS